MNSSNSPVTKDSLTKAKAFAHWIVPGETLMVRNRVLQVSRCQVVFHPESIKQEAMQDVVEIVNFWYDTPVEGAIPYYYNNESKSLEPIQSEPQPNTQRAWLIQYTNAYARAIRRLYKHFYQEKD